MAKQRRKSTTQKARTTVSRRNFIEAVIATGVISALPATARDAPAARRKSPGSAHTAGADAELKVLSPEQGIVLTAVLNRVIPASDGMPAAGAIDVTRYIDGVLADAPHLRQPILGLLTELPGVGRVTRLTDAHMDALLAQLQAADSDNFDVLLRVTYTGYYSHPKVLAKLGWTPRGEAKPKTFDTRLQDDLRARGPIYYDV